MSCTFSTSVRVGVRILGMNIGLKTWVRVRFRVRVCGYDYNRGLGLWICVQSTGYAEKREIYEGYSVLEF